MHIAFRPIWMYSSKGRFCSRITCGLTAKLNQGLSISRDISMDGFNELRLASSSSYSYETVNHLRKSISVNVSKNAYNRLTSLVDITQCASILLYTHMFYMWYEYVLCSPYMEPCALLGLKKSISINNLDVLL